MTELDVLTDRSYYESEYSDEIRLVSIALIDANGRLSEGMFLDRTDFVFFQTFQDRPLPLSIDIGLSSC